MSAVRGALSMLGRDGDVSASVAFAKRTEMGAEQGVALDALTRIGAVEALPLADELMSVSSEPALRQAASDA
ncbi:hypothetical protein CLD22_03420 [Rubrivivax gelatinosus]|nr:hypothetical protein [Rubrivivax gelatinosus]